MSAKARGAKAPGAGEGGERMDIGGARLQTVKISWFESRGALPALAFLGEIRVLVWFVN